MKKSIAEICFQILFGFFILFFRVPSIHALTAYDIQTTPSSPTYNTIFECVIPLDENSSFLACDMLPFYASDAQKPWDICKKRKSGETGFIYYENGKRHYRCRAESSVGVPGPGRYRMVAWNFVGDGYEGTVIFSKEIDILHYSPPTYTPTPISSPTWPPYLSPTLTSFFPSPTASYYFFPTPTKKTSQLNNPSPTSLQLPTGTSNIPNYTFISPSITQSAYSNIQKTPAPTSRIGYDSWIPRLPLFVFPTIKLHIQSISNSMIQKGGEVLLGGRNLTFGIIRKFLIEASF